MSALLLEIALKSGLVCAAALALVLAARRLPAAKRAVLAHLGLLATLAAPILILVGPDLPVTGFWSQVVEIAPAVNVPTSVVAPITPLAEAATSPAAAVRLNPLAATWAVVSLGLIGGLGLGLVRLFRLQRRASVLTDRDWLGALAQAQHRMGVKQGTALLRSEGLRSPVSWGLLRPTIVLSPEALKTPDRAEAILAHELAHVVRMDWVNLLIARLATAVFWFNPLVWILAWQAHELREEAADDVVLRGDVDAPDYASLLVGFARRELRAPALAAHGVAPGKASLKRRLLRVLDGSARRDPASAGWTLACALGVAAVAAPLAAFTPVDRLAPATASTPPVVPETSLARDGSAELRETPAPIDAPVVARMIDAEAPEAALISPEPRVGRFEANAAPAPQTLSPDTIAQMRLHGVTPEWIASLETELPWVRGLTADRLVTLAIHRVSKDWVRDLRLEGYDGLNYNQLVSLAVHRVGADYVRELASVGYDRLSVDRLVQMKIYGVDAAYVRRMEATGVREDPAGMVARLNANRGRRRGPPPVPAWPPTQTPGVPTPPVPPVPAY